MTYSYQDQNGFLAHGPSIGGAKALLDTLQSGVDEKLYPCLHELLTTGVTQNTEQLAGECRRLATQINDEDVKSTLNRLASAASLAKGQIEVTH